MKNLLRSASVSLALAFAALTAHAVEPGYVDIGQFTAVEGCDFVEIDLNTSLLKFASRFVEKDDQETAALIRGLKRVRVNVVGYNDATRDDTTGRVQKFRRDLSGEGWQTVVTARETGKADDVMVFVKLNAEDEIDGVVVSVLDATKCQVVLVNVVGRLKAEQLAKLGHGLHIDPLSNLHLTYSSKGT